MPDTAPARRSGVDQRPIDDRYDPVMAGDRAEDVATEDRDAVRELLGREPLAAFVVVVRRIDGKPVVIRNAPLLPDGRPMPTRYWLLDPALNREIGRLEADGGVDASEREVDAVALAAAHDRYATERDAAIPTGHTGPRPSGGVGGTRVGVKCLHAHYAHFLATGDDPVGGWVAERLSPELRAIGQTRESSTSPGSGVTAEPLLPVPPPRPAAPVPRSTPIRPEEHTDG